MHLRFDRLAKDTLQPALDRHGQALPEVHIAADAQRADLCFLPGPPRQADTTDTGLLARIGMEPCLLEYFHEPPATEEVSDCLRKLLTWQHVRRREAGRAPADPAVPASAQESLWVLSAGRPDRALQGFALEPMAGWPAGAYTGPLPELRYRLIAINELPETRDTLLLRFLGRGATFRRALREIAALDADAWERRLALPLLVQLQIEIEDNPSIPLSPEEKEVLVTAQELVQSIENKAKNEGRKEGRDQGRKEGRAQLLLHQFARKLGRPLTEGEQTTLQERVAVLGPDRVGDVVLDMAPRALEDWLADTNAI